MVEFYREENSHKRKKQAGITDPTVWYQKNSKHIARENIHRNLSHARSVICHSFVSSIQSHRVLHTSTAGLHENAMDGDTWYHLSGRWKSHHKQAWCPALPCFSTEGQEAHTHTEKLFPLQFIMSDAKIFYTLFTFSIFLGQWFPNKLNTIKPCLKVVLLKCIEWAPGLEASHLRINIFYFLVLHRLS